MANGNLLVKFNTPAKPCSSTNTTGSKQTNSKLNCNPGLNPQQFQGQIQGVVNKLKTVSTGTTAYKEAEQLLKSAYKKLNQI